MAAETHQKIRPHAAVKPKRRKKRGDSVSVTVSPPPTTKKEPPSVSLDASWCCAPNHRRNATTGKCPPESHRHHFMEATKPTSETNEIPKLSRQSSENQLETNKPTLEIAETASLSRQSSSSDQPYSPFRSRLSPGRISPVMDASSSSSYPSSYTKFNSALSAGLLNPMSPPPSRLSPTLFEMMSNEPESQARNPNQPQPSSSSSNNVRKPPATTMTLQDKHLLMRERVNEILCNSSPGNRFNDSGSSDVKLTLSSKEGFSASVCVHHHVLSANSRFFSAKLANRLSTMQPRTAPHLVEIPDCEDVEVYLETLHLMYCDDLKRRLMKEDVSKVLEILKVSAAIVFDAGILACLEYLEAAPWAEDEEEKVANLLSQLQLDSTSAAGEVLKRVSMETPTSSEEEIVVRLLDVVLQGKDDKARKEMKGLVSKMLRENCSHQNTNSSNLLDISKDSLYAACNSCLDLLLYDFSKAAQLGFLDKSNQHERSVVGGEISRQTDNLNWVLEILIDRQIAEDFTRIWASQAELAKLHTMVPTMYRYEVSRLTARLCVGIGKGQILTPREVRSLLLQTWLEPLYNDFGWMRRGCKSMDQNVVEEGLGQTILTLPLSQQQTILLNWFDRFSNSGDECPNIQKAFEVWWRRAFWRRSNDPDRQRQLQIATMRVYENGS